MNKPSLGPTLMAKEPQCLPRCSHRRSSLAPSDNSIEIEPGSPGNRKKTQEPGEMWNGDGFPRKISPPWVQLHAHCLTSLSGVRRRMPIAVDETFGRSTANRRSLRSRSSRKGTHGVRLDSQPSTRWWPMRREEEEKRVHAVFPYLVPDKRQQLRSISSRRELDAANMGPETP
ncbi:hypothetical protein LZ30DRAFT_65091 [Colletotrichum cereale]|nr:hypothetical protein LZ30DRAFT_65091 [Colletotrichum cereale]